MSDKKHIDRLFQEGFKDFEAIPGDAVWENIEAKLNQKKKKNRVIPVWWRYAGIAALLLLLVTIGGTFFNNTEDPQTKKVVDTKDLSPSNLKDDPSNDSDNLINPKEAITDNSDLQNDLKGASQNGLDILTDNINTSKETSVADVQTTKNEVNRSTSSNKESNGSDPILKTDDKTGIAVALNNKNNESINNKAKEALIDTDKADVIITKNHSEIADTTDDEKTPTIEEVLDKTKDIIEEEEKLNRWRIVPNAAPVYFSSLGDGSSIDPQFNNNSKTGEVNMSYGITASYAINKKLSIRSGINKVNLGYNTNNVVVFQSVGVSRASARSLQNVTIDENNTKIEPLTLSSIEGVSIISGEGLSASNMPESFASSNTSINQTLGYIEMPIEIQYSLLNKKMGVTVIGGFSSFFLSDNKIFSETEGGSKIFLGEANNINKVSHSANFGLGFNYNISKKIDLNLEPMFKYQINTFSNTSGNFKPYFIGVYTGFSIKF